ncbi:MULTISPECIES: dual specificity protein phosphatase family protein [unclassified Paenibacillus]|uniref:protein-tyrosine phosphatase family protein n=1 Tax=unclassified Paenibacillus TaxID=185978 RepID=UPI001AE5600B|nr:protein-tyrosine phosphatase [Paenibacillus sp. PvP091]MBP1168986.1 protein-tyrosine phosphatase [Paenibacillus sp. PvR098]MBP2440014.1 protein-tyrosine phosphatase [Paenibacillus sp. PvP052]
MAEQKKSYQALVDKQIFIGGAQDVQAFIDEEQCEVIVDLRAESPEVELGKEGVSRIHVPLMDKQEGQEALLKQAIDTVVKEAQAGKKVAIHCAAGRSRAGSVAIGTLLALGISDSVDDAEARIQEIRPEVVVHEKLKKSVAELFQLEDLNKE